MARQVDSGPPADPGEDLLRAALADPKAAQDRARTILDAGPGPCLASYAHQAAGIVLRDTGRTKEAIAALRRARRAARRSGLAAREADVLATLGTTLAMDGQTAAGLAWLDAAAQMERGPARGRILMRRGAVLDLVGHHATAVGELSRACASLRRAGDALWESRALQARGLSRLYLGDAGRADADFARAEILLGELGQDFEAAIARHNRGLAAFRAGRLPEALRHLGDAQDRYVALRMWMPDLAIDRADVLLAAGLIDEARDTLAAAVGRMERDGSQRTILAEMVLASARAAAAAGDTDAAGGAARRARRMFRAQDRAIWSTRADLLIVESAFLAGDRSLPTLRLAEATAERLAAQGSPDAPGAHLIAGRIALTRGNLDRAAPLLERAAARRHRGAALARSSAWLAQAIHADQRGAGRTMLNACRRGIAALDEHLGTLGATELRAHATRHGAELVDLAQRHALRTDDPVALLRWTERWRGVSTRPAGVGMPSDPELAADLAALRELSKRVDRAIAAGDGAQALMRSRDRLETRIRRRTLSAPSAAGTAVGAGPDPLDRDRFGPWTLVMPVHVGDDLVAVVRDRRRTRIHRVGAMAAARQELQYAVFALRRAALAPAGRPWGGDLEAIGARLQEALLGPAAAALGDGPIVVCPPGELVGIPWGLMPGLARRPFAITPSCEAWVRTAARVPPPGATMTLIAGPGLGTGGAEVRALGRAYPHATVVRGRGATAEAALRAMDGVRVAHVAAHGQFRTENPLFSALHLHDGPLTIHDLSSLRRAPYRLILSSCESGAAARAGSDDLLGLTSCLLAMGTAGVASAVTVIHDVASVAVSLTIHAALHRGASLADALLAARERDGASETERATAAAFIPVGA